MARTRKLTIELVGEDKSASKTLASVDKKSGGLSKTFSALKGAAVAGGAAIAGGLAVSVKAFADFDAALNESLAIMGDVSDMQREEMSDAAREVAKTTKFSATEAAESYFFLASAGLDAEQSIAALPQVAAFAQAGMFDMALATDLATDAQSALGLTVDDAAQNLENLTRVTDVLVKANTLANASVQQFSEALTNKAGAALKLANKDIEEGVAVLAAFADQGVKGVQAGEALSIILRDVTTAAAKEADAFADLGIEVFDAEGNLKNMADVVFEFEDALGGMSDAEKATTLRTLGLTQAVGDNLKILLGTSDQIREYEDALRDAGGVTQEVADKQLQTFWAQLGLLRDRLMDIAIEIGSRVVPALMPLVDWAADTLPKAFEAAEAFVAEWGPKVRAAIQPVVDWVEDNWPGFRDTVVGAFETVAAWVRANWPAFKTAVLGAFEEIKVFVDRNWPAIRDTITDVMTIIGAAVVFAVRFIQVVWDAWGQDLLNTVITVWNFIKTTIESALGVLRGIIKLVASLIRGDWAGAWEAIKLIVSNAWDFMVGLVTLAVNAIKILLSAAWTAIKLAVQAGWEAIVAVFTGIWDGITSAAGDAADGVVGWFSALPGRLLGLVGSIGEAAASIGTSIADSLVGAITSGLGAAVSLAATLGDIGKAVANAVIGVVNSGIASINSMIPNEIGFSVAGRDIGFNIPDNPIPSVPELAEGGIVTATPGGILARLGEGGRDEVVKPLPRGMDADSGTTVVNNFDMRGAVITPSRIEDVIVNALEEAARKGKAPTIRGARLSVQR